MRYVLGKDFLACSSAYTFESEHRFPLLHDHNGKGQKYHLRIDEQVFPTFQEAP